jgi:membrane associated rhomboid family serine protease
MLFFPYKADVDLGRWPVMTLLVCALCIWVFVRQLISGYEYQTALENFCDRGITRDELIAARYLDLPPGQTYCGVLLQIREAPNRQIAIQQLAAGSKPTPFYRNRQDSVDYVRGVLAESSRRFERAVPRNLTDELHYDPSTLSVTNMLTAAFTHASPSHLIFNLLFFFAFAASVEVIIGYLYFAGFIVVAAIGTHLAYAYSVYDVVGAPPTVGLSGVVMAMMAFLATVVPTLSIRCFFWFLVIIRIFRIPALALAGLYILWNVYDYVNRDAADLVNYEAHLSGAAIGVVLGIVYRLRYREYVKDLLPGI